MTGRRLSITGKLDDLVLNPDSEIARDCCPSKRVWWRCRGTVSQSGRALSKRFEHGDDLPFDLPRRVARLRDVETVLALVRVAECDEFGTLFLRSDPRYLR